MSKSNYLKAQTMNASLGASTFTPAANLYVRLYTTTPDLDGSGGVEVDTADWTDYSPVVVANNKISWGSAATVGSYVQLSNAIDFSFGLPTLLVSSITVVGMAIWDAASGGNMYYKIPLTLSKLILNGQEVLFTAGSITISES